MQRAGAQALQVFVLVLRRSHQHRITERTQIVPPRQRTFRTERLVPAGKWRRPGQRFEPSGQRLLAQKAALGQEQDGPRQPAWLVKYEGGGIL